MHVLSTLLSLGVIGLFLFEAFEAMVLTRRITRPFRLTVLYYRAFWSAWRLAAHRLPAGKWRDNFLGLFGPWSVLSLIALWIVGLISGFGLLHWSLATPLNSVGPDDEGAILTYLYLSGVTFFTVGFGEVTARHDLGRFLTVVEAGLGFMFLAVTIGYLPVFYSLFSRREVFINLLDARAGSPPTAGQVLLRAAQARRMTALNELLADGERWSAEFLESCLSYPVLAYYRSQHDNQSWLATLTTVLDTSALLIACVEDADTYQAQLSFAMARHAVVDMALVFHLPPLKCPECRLPAEQYQQLRTALKGHGVLLRDGPTTEAHLAELRATYEPFLMGLSTFFVLGVPPVFAREPSPDNWQTSAWMRRTAGIGRLPGTLLDDHE